MKPATCNLQRLATSKLGLKTYWPSGVAYQQFAEMDLLQPVLVILSHYERYALWMENYCG